MATPFSTASSSDANDRSGLDSIALVCLQALKQNQEEEKKKINRNPSTASTIICQPPPPSLELSARVVSMENVETEETITNNEDYGSSSSFQVSKNRCTEPPPAHQIKETTSRNIYVANEAGFSASYATEPVSGVLCRKNDSPPSSLPPPPSSSPSSLSNGTPQTANFSNILADPEGWFRQTANMFVELPPIEKSSKDANPIAVQPNDVLCGRGGETNHHSGNVQYRSLVKAYQKLYLLAKRRDKPKIAQCIVVSVRGVGGRFLKRISSTEHGPGWVDVGHVKAREKTSQALREGAPDLRQSSTNTNKKGGGTTTATNTSHKSDVVKSQQYVLAQTHPIEHGVANVIPSASNRFNGLMNLRMPTSSSNFNHAHINNSNGDTKGPAPSPSPSFLYKTTSKSLPSSSSIVDKDAVLKTKAFTTAAANLMQHPIFHQLTLSQQQEAILHEFNAAARAAAASSTDTETTRPPRAISMLPPKSSPPPSLTADNIHQGQQGRTSPSLMIQQQQQQLPPPRPPQFSHHSHHHQQQYYPPQIYGHGYSYYQRDQYGHYPPYLHYPPPHDGKNLKNDDNVVGGGDDGTNKSCSASSTSKASSRKNVDLHSMYREVMVAKAAAAAGASGNNKTATQVRAMTKPNSKDSTCDDHINDKKRKVPRVTMISPAIVSDDSLSSAQSNLSTTINNNNIPLVEGAGVESSVGPRLKRLKLRLNTDS